MAKAERKITPVQVLPDIKEATTDLNIPEGMVFIMEVKNGVEVEGSGFTYPASKAAKYYSDPTKFVIKKKVNK